MAIFSGTPKDTADYLKQLEDRLKLKRSGSTLFGSDVNPGFIEPTGTPVKNILPSSYNAQPLQAQNLQLPEMPQVPLVQGGQSGESDSQEFLRAVYESAQQTIPQPQQQLADGGVLYSDNVIRYPDGTTRTGDPSAQPLQSLADGSVRYSDGSTRPAPLQVVQQLPSGAYLMTDGSVKSEQQLTQTGDLVTDLQNLFFGQVFQITQPYGNYNPSLEPNAQGINYGTDIGAEYQPITLPFSAKVIQVIQDDGVKDPYRSATAGYGNSILVQLSNGQYLRFSHLSQTPAFIEGETIGAGTTIGVSGNTGNTTGPHLDLEILDQNGQPISPDQFTGFQDPSVMQSMISTGDSQSVDPQDREIVDAYVSQNRQSRETQNTQPTQLQPEQLSNPAAQSINEPRQPTSPLAQGVADTIQNANLTGQYGTGLAYSLEGRPEQARAQQLTTVAAATKRANLPELQTTELSNTQGTGFLRQLAGNIADVAGTSLRKAGIDTSGITGGNLSEKIAGGKTTNTDTYAQELINQALASASQKIQGMGKDIVNATAPLGQNRALADYQPSNVTQNASQGVEQFQPNVQNIASQSLLQSNVFKPITPFGGQTGNVTPAEMSAQISPARSILAQSTPLNQQVNQSNANNTSQGAQSTSQTTSQTKQSSSKPVFKSSKDRSSSSSNSSNSSSKSSSEIQKESNEKLLGKILLDKINILQPKKSTNNNIFGSLLTSVLNKSVFKR